MISNLKMLRSLRMFECSSVQQDSGSILFRDGHVFVKELLGLSHLEVLTVTLKCFDALEILLSSPGLKSTRTPALCFRRCEKTLRVFPLRHPEPFTLWSVMVAVCYRR